MEERRTFTQVTKSGDSPRALRLVYRRWFRGEAIEFGRLTFAEVSSGTAIGVRFRCPIAVSRCSSRVQELGG